MDGFRESGEELLLNAQKLRKRAIDVGFLFLLCGVVGVIAGLGAAGFFCMLQYAKHLFLDGIAGYRPGGPLGEVSIFSPTARPFSRWLLFILPAAGGLVSGILVYVFAPEAEGHGTDAAIEAYHSRAGRIRARVPFVKAVTSAITMGTGGSAGREGPIAQIGAGLGSTFAGWLGLSIQQRRVLMVAGLGAGIGAIFRAPLAGALFSAEVLYRNIDIEHEVLATAILSSIIAHSVFGMFFGWQPLFQTPEFVFDNPMQLAAYAGLALVVAAGAFAYVRVFYGVRDAFRKIPLPRWSKPAIGGLVVGAIGLAVPQALSTSFGVLQDSFLGNGTAALLFAVAGAKILTTAFTVASGGSGGVFGPAVVIGGAIGGGVGLILHGWAPHLVPEPGAFAMVGMAGFFAAAASTPISTVIMVSELTGNYRLLVPAMLVCMTGFLLMRGRSIYEKQPAGRADSPAHQADMMRETMERLSVRDAISLRPSSPPEFLREGTPLAAVFERFAAGAHTCLPVSNAKGEMVGVVSLDAVRRTMGESAMAPMVVALDLALSPVAVSLDDSIYSAVQEMTAHGRREVVVVDGPEERVVDVLTSADIARLYESRSGRKLADASDDGPLGKWFARLSTKGAEK